MENSQLPEDVEDFVRNFIGKNFWKPAKSGPPHSYYVREWNPERDDEFVKMVNVIREYGQPERFWSKTYIYLYVDGKKYWTMGFPIEETKLINCAQGQTRYGYDR